MEVLTMLFSLCALYISVLTLMPKKLLFIIQSACALIIVIFFKPLLLWGVAGGFMGIFRLECATSVIIATTLGLSIFLQKPKNLSSLPLNFWYALPFVASPFITIGASWFIGQRWMDNTFLTMDLPSYIQLLSGEYKITFETFQDMSEHYVLTLFFLLVIYQLVALAVALFCALSDFIHHVNAELYVVAPHFLCRAHISHLIIILVLLPTNILVAFLSKILSYFV